MWATNLKINLRSLLTMNSLNKKNTPNTWVFLLTTNYHGKKHIQTTNLKISKGIVIIRKMQHFLQEKQLRNMYNAFNKHFFVLKSKPYKIFAKEFEKTLSDDLLNTPVILS